MPPSEDGSEKEGAGCPTVRVIGADGTTALAVERPPALCYHWWVRTLAAALLVLVACHGARDRGPAWPKSAGTVAPDDYQDDGGESLEPRTNHVAAIEVSADDRPAPVADSPKPAAPSSDKGTATETSTTPAAPTTDTIEIQIEDIQVGPGDIIINSP